MRYISQIPNLELFSYDGKTVKYKFNEQGEYYGDQIDAYDETNKVFTLQVRGDGKDLKGGTIADIATTFVPEEACGLGSLNGYSNKAILNGLPNDTVAANKLDLDDSLAFRKGLRGFFFLAPEITIAASTVLIPGKWMVVKGVFTYNSATYLPGQYVVLPLGFTEPAAEGLNTGVIIKLMVPCIIDGDCTCDDTKDEHFRIVHLMHKDDAEKYYVYNSIGYKNPEVPTTEWYRHIANKTMTPVT